MRWVMAALVMGMLLGNPALAQTASPDGPLNGLTTTWPVVARGDVHTSTQEFALRFDPTDAFATFRLKAEKIVLEMEWERGFAVGDGQSVAVTTDQDVMRATLKNVDLSIHPFQDEPLVFATASGQDGVLSLRTPTDAVWTSVQDVDVVTEGMSPETQTAGDEKDLGFWYTVEGPTVETQASGDLRLDGTFSLFLHNLEVHAKGDHETEWSHWTGYHEEDSALTAKEYEFRVTTAQVQNGTLVARPYDEARHYTTSLDVQVDGTVTAQSVTGQLVRTSRTFRFNEEPLDLEGKGDLHLKAESAAGQPRLLVQPSEGLRVANNLPPEDPDASSAFPLQTMLLGPLAALLLVTATTTGLSRTSTGRRIRHEAWSRRAEAAVYDGNWDRSSKCFRRAIRARPDVANTWHDLIQSELQAGHGEMADKFAVQAVGVPGMDPWDILAMRAAAAWLRDDTVALHEYLERLHEGAPEMAQALAQSFQIEQTPRPEDPIDGYA